MQRPGVDFRSPFLVRVKFRVGEIEQVSLSDAWAMFRYKAFIRLRDWINERIGRIDSSGAVLRLTTADDYRRMQEFRMDKAHQLKFPRIMYHATLQSVVVRSKTQVAGLLLNGYDFRPVFSEPGVAEAQMVALKGSLRTANDRAIDLRQRSEDTNKELMNSWRHAGELKRALREAEAQIASMQTELQSQEVFQCL